MKYILLILVVLSSFSNAEYKVVHSSSFGSDWPFIVDSVKLMCDNRNSIKVPYVISGGIAYGLTGYASNIFSPVDKIWANNSKLPGTKINLGPIRDEALKMCR